MILYQNSLMQLNLEPANSLMEVNWPNFEAYSVDETKLALSRLVNTVKTYEVKKLLVDASNAKLNAEAEDYEEIIRHYTSLLQETNLEKIARLVTDVPERENRSRKLQKYIPASIQIQNFENATDARTWLLDQGN